MSKPIRVAINGFGRIGRTLVRAWVSRAFENIDIVAINDIAPAQDLAHLLAFDSTYGRFDGDIKVQAEYLIIGTHAGERVIQMLSESEPSRLNWQQLDVDVVLECTGLFRTRQLASQHLSAGAKRVIIGAAPFDQVDASVVYGVNHHQLTAAHRIISSVSCTTQALVPLVKILDDNFKLISGMVTEIHAVTADQVVLDHVHRDIRRGRGAFSNIIPTTSSALGALKQILPKLGQCIEGYSLRVPTHTVAALDFTFSAHEPLDRQKINSVFFQAAQHDYAHILQTNQLPLVSSDFIGQPFSLIFDETQTQISKHLAKVVVWYDNEYGYSHRLLDIVRVLPSN